MYSRSPPRKLLNFLKSARKKSCVITFHSVADVDACAGAVALQQYLGKKTIIAMQDGINSQAKKVMGAYGIERIGKFASITKQFPNAHIIVLDCNERHLLPELLDRKIEIIIDHHAKNQKSASAECEWIDPQSSSVCQMLSQIIKNPDAQQAELMALGIISDSANFANSDADTFKQISRLLKRCSKDYSQLQTILHPKKSMQERMRVLEGLRNINFARSANVICATAQVPSNESRVAELLLRAGADCAFVGSGEKTRCVISARMRDEWIAHVPLIEIMQETGAFLGGNGGGHPAAAAASGKYAHKLEDALNMCQRAFFSHSVARIKIA